MEANEAGTGTTLRQSAAGTAGTATAAAGVATSALTLARPQATVPEQAQAGASLGMTAAQTAETAVGNSRLFDDALPRVGLATAAKQTADLARRGVEKSDFGRAEIASTTFNDISALGAVADSAQRILSRKATSNMPKAPEADSAAAGGEGGEESSAVARGVTQAAEAAGEDAAVGDTVVAVGTTADAAAGVAGAAGAEAAGVAAGAEAGEVAAAASATAALDATAAATSWIPGIGELAIGAALTGTALSAVPRKHKKKVPAPVAAPVATFQAGLTT
jgi:hypothetical protein